MKKAFSKTRRKKAVHDLESQKDEKPVSQSWRHLYEEKSSKFRKPESHLKKNDEKKSGQKPESQKASYANHEDIGMKKIV